MAPNPEKLNKIKEHSHKSILFGVALQSDSQRVFTGASDFNVHAFEPLADKLELQTFAGHTSYVSCVGIVGDQLISGGWDGKLIWWNIQDGDAIRTVDCSHNKWIRNLAVSPDGDTVASVADDMKCRVWNVKEGKLKIELKGHESVTPNDFPSMLYAVAISPDGKQIAAGDRIGKVIVWDANDGKQLAAFETPEMYTWDPKARIHSIGGIRSLAFSPDSKLLAVGGMGQVGNIDHLGGLSHVEVFDWKQAERKHELKGDKFKGLVERLHFSPDGKWLLAAGGDNSGFLQFYDLATNKAIKQEKAPMHVHDCVLNQDATTIYAVGHNKIAVWEL